jgi:hypothetical protein
MSDSLISPTFTTNLREPFPDVRTHEDWFAHPWNLVAIWLDTGATFVEMGGEWRDMGETMMRCARMLERGLIANCFPPYDLLNFKECDNVNCVICR